MQKHKKTLALLAILSLVVTNGFYSSLVNIANAGSLTSAKDTISNSNVSASATHVIKFTTKTALIAGDEIQANFAGGFTNVLAVNTTCTGAAFAGGTLPAANTVNCAAAGVIATNTVLTITVTGVVNPGTAGSQIISLNSKHTGFGSPAIDRADVMVAIISNVAVSAYVPSSLLFTISPVATGTNVNNGVTTSMSATTSLAFGTLTVGTSSIMAQQLAVTTNAGYGYTVTVEQNQDLTSNSGAIIDSFKDGTPTRSVWSAPLGTLDATTTYGHMGFTSDDATLQANFAAGEYDGFIGTTPEEVMYHTGPADGSTQNKGLAKVAYRIQISALQEAGDYYNTLTYVATPTY
ncbi:MAG: hypothetical protein WCG01_02760 [bacterium]